MDCEEEEDNNISEQYEYFYQDDEPMGDVDYFSMNSVDDEDDPEYFPYEVFDLSRFDPMLASTVESLYSETSLPKPILKHLLIVFKWDLSKITSKLRENRSALLQEARLEPCPEKPLTPNGRPSLKGVSNSTTSASAPQNPLQSDRSSLTTSSATSRRLTTATGRNGSSPDAHALPPRQVVDGDKRGDSVKDKHADKRQAKPAKTQKFGVLKMSHHPITSAAVKSEPAASCSQQSLHAQTDADQPAAGTSSESSSVALVMPRPSRNLPLTPTNVNFCFVCDRPGRPVLALQSSVQLAAQSPTQTQSVAPRTDGEQLVDLVGLACGHRFCLDCWNAHLSTAVREARSLLGLECMAVGCTLVATEEFILTVLIEACDRERYKSLSQDAYIASNPLLRHCPRCPLLIHATKAALPRRVECNCKHAFCFLCTAEHHAPAPCSILKEWFAKCYTDELVATWILANCKSCPECRVIIEKNQGCNHMTCKQCKHEFCWVCMKDWKSHGGNYYSCSTFNSEEATKQAGRDAAKESLLKYMHYYQRWENHGNSLKLEAEFRERIRRKIDSDTKVTVSANVARVSSQASSTGSSSGASSGKGKAKAPATPDAASLPDGTWIEHQHLYEAADLLKDARYTLRYTYPYAYFMPIETQAQKDAKTMFEARQNHLEEAVEELAHMIENATTNSRQKLLQQMSIVKHQRKAMLRC